MKTAQSSGKRPVHQAAPEDLSSVLKGARSCWRLAMPLKASGSTAETPRKKCRQSMPPPPATNPPKRCRRKNRAGPWAGRNADSASPTTRSSRDKRDIGSCHSFFPAPPRNCRCSFATKLMEQTAFSPEPSVRKLFTTDEHGYFKKRKGLTRLQPQPKRRNPGRWDKSLGDEPTNFSHRHRYSASLS